MNRFYEKLSGNDWVNQLRRSRDGKVATHTWGLFKEVNTGKAVVKCLDKYHEQHQYRLETLRETVSKNEGILLDDFTGLQIEASELAEMVEHFDEVVSCSIR